MTAQTCARVQTATLSTTTADTITFSTRHRCLKVTNHHASEILNYRVDGSTAVRDADENFLVLGNSFATMDPFTASSVSVVGSGNKYTVEVW